ncbi:MAG: carbohydrate ABC transporter permease [Eubacteriales bacterium]
MKKKISKINYDKYGYFFVAPFFLVFLFFQVYPMLYTVNLSFTDFTGWSKEYKYNGIENYIWLIKNSFFLKSIGNTFLLWIANFIPQMCIALLFAALFTNDRVKIPGTGFFKVVFYMPNIITAASVALIFGQLFGHPYGPVEQMLKSLGLVEEIQFFQSKAWTRGIIVFIQFWMWFGQNMIVYMATILSINPSLFEAARIDGAGDGQIFFRITVPLLKPMLIYILVTSMVGGLQMFDIPFLLNGGGPDYASETLATYIYKQAFTGQQNYNIASAGSMYLLFMALIISGVIFKVLKGKDDDVPKGGRRREKEKNS